MGYYIQTNGSKGKASYLVATHNATVLPEAPNWADVPKDKAVVCVVDNGIFEAAGYAYSASELSYFNSPSDYREKE